MQTVGSLALLAHQGGWDEILMVLVPISLMVAVIVAIERRIKARSTSRTSAEL